MPSFLAEPRNDGLLLGLRSTICSRATWAYLSNRVAGWCGIGRVGWCVGTKLQLTDYQDCSTHGKWKEVYEDNSLDTFRLESRAMWLLLFCRHILLQSNELVGT